ncbi:MAG: hypothetical protein V1697_00485 [Candidatus Levyibacteriota bacterium]
MKTARFIKFFVVCLFLVLFLFSTQKQAFAQNYNYQPRSSYTTPVTNPDVPKNLHTYSQSVIIELMSSVSCLVVGVDPVSVNRKCLGIDTNTGKIGYVEKNGGLIGVSANLIAMTYKIPIHTSDYVDYMASNFGVTKSAYAQDTGVGFEGIRPLLSLWVVFRDIVYLLFVIVFVLIGIAIMLRVKIDPRTVMSIQNQIPRIIVALVLVTLSFAIAGFLIDLMWIFTFLIINLFSDANISPKLNAAEVGSKIMGNPFVFINDLLGWGGFGLLKIPASIGVTVFEILANLLKFDFDLGGGVIAWILNAVTSPIRNIIGVLGGIAGFLVIAIALAIALFRLWFTLIQAFVMIILDIIIAPFWIMSGVIPGRSIGFGSWFKDILANLSAFPAVVFLFILTERLMNAYESTTTSAPFVPPLLGGTIAQDSIKGIIAFGMIMASPKIVSMIKAALKAPKYDTSSVIGGATAAAGVIGQPSRVGWNRLTRRRDPWGHYSEGKLRGLVMGKPGTENRAQKWIRRVAEGSFQDAKQLEEQRRR